MVPALAFPERTGHQYTRAYRMRSILKPTSVPSSIISNESQARVFMRGRSICDQLEPAVISQSMTSRPHIPFRHFFSYSRSCFTHTFIHECMNTDLDYECIHPHLLLYSHRCVADTRTGTFCIYRYFSLIFPITSWTAVLFLVSSRRSKCLLCSD